MRWLEIMAVILPLFLFGCGAATIVKEVVTCQLGDPNCDFH